jgi:hypothetical protein
MRIKCYFFTLLYFVIGISFAGCGHSFQTMRIRWDNQEAFLRGLHAVLLEPEVQRIKNVLDQKNCLKRPQEAGKIT